MLLYHLCHFAFTCFAFPHFSDIFGFLLSSLYEHTRHVLSLFYSLLCCPEKMHPSKIHQYHLAFFSKQHQTTTNKGFHQLHVNGISSYTCLFKTSSTVYANTNPHNKPLLLGESQKSNPKPPTSIHNIHHHLVGISIHHKPQERWFVGIRCAAKDVGISRVLARIHVSCSRWWTMTISCVKIRRPTIGVVSFQCIFQLFPKGYLEGSLICINYLFRDKMPSH